VEAFLAAYFEAQGWWQRPCSRDGETDEIAPHSDLPEYEL
jgi:hypothetical protein